MAEALLGETIDIHGGGHDLIFPHHENEIAQSTCAHGGKVFARYWLHNGFLNVDSQKMSKSIGNVLLVHELLKNLPGEAIRLVLLTGHYRQPIDWTDDVVAEARKKLDRLYGALRDLGDIAPADGVKAPQAFIDEQRVPLELRRRLAVKQLEEVAGDRRLVAARVDPHPAADATAPLPAIAGAAVSIVTWAATAISGLVPGGSAVNQTITFTNPNSYAVNYTAKSVAIDSVSGPGVITVSPPTSGLKGCPAVARPITDRFSHCPKPRERLPESAWRRSCTRCWSPARGRSRTSASSARGANRFPTTRLRIVPHRHGPSHSTTSPATRLACLDRRCSALPRGRPRRRATGRTRIPPR